MSYTAAVITVSDKGARDERIDTSGPALCAVLKDNGWEMTYTAIVPDELEQIKKTDQMCGCKSGYQDLCGNTENRTAAQYSRTAAGAKVQIVLPMDFSRSASARGSYES